MLRRQLAQLAVAALMLLSSRPASACSIAAHTPLTIVQPDTGAAPGALGMLTVSTKRGTGPPGGCDRTTTSCDDIGTIHLSFVAPRDPDSAPEAIGYRLTRVAGQLPAGMVLPEHPVLAFVGRDAQRMHLHLAWLDGNSDEQEGIDFSLVITPVDSNGNQGPPSEVVHIRSGDTRGCGLNGSAPPGHALGAAFGLLIVVACVRRHGGVRRRLSVP